MVEIGAWQLTQPLAPCRRINRYRLYFGAAGVTRVRDDNERGKGDQRHIGDQEEAYAFTSREQSLDDFRRDVEGWR